MDGGRSEDVGLDIRDEMTRNRQQNKEPQVKLFSILVLLNTYVPESYLLMSECQQILGPPDPIHGGPPFEERMKSYISLISTCNPMPGHVALNDPELTMEELGDSVISRSATIMILMFSLCGNQAEPYVIQFIKDVLTKREMGENGKRTFSRLIEDICEHEGFYKALHVLITASKKFTSNPFFPQVISRLNYIARSTPNYKEAEKWAKIAIQRAPDNSYVADTLGQIYKNILLKANQNPKNLYMVGEAFNAFRDVERKAEREVAPDMNTGTGNNSVCFNNRGLFGFLQVARIAYEKLNAQQRSNLIQNKKLEVADRFDFFEWYLTFSKPDMITSEPPYFWKEVACCYEYYTTTTAAESTSFSGLLDLLNRGLFTSRGSRAGFLEDEITVSDLEAIHDVLKTTYEQNGDVTAAERYILSNIILSNRMPDSPQLTPVNKLRTIILKFLTTERSQRSPEFFLLVLLLFWPEERPPAGQEEVDEEVEQTDGDDDSSEDKTSEDQDSNKEQETQGEPSQPLDHTIGLELQQYVTLMEKAFERGKHAKYLRGRYLLPLFFLGKRPGLSKWIHKSKLDAIMEEKVDAELVGDTFKTKSLRIDEMWMTGEVWHVPEIEDILLPVRLEPCPSSVMSQEQEEQEEQEVFICAHGQKIKVSVEAGTDASGLSSMPFYLGFNIKKPVLFPVGVPQISHKD